MKSNRLKKVILVGQVSQTLLEKIQSSLSSNNKKWEVYNLVSMAEKQHTQQDKYHTDYINFDESKEIKNYFSNPDILAVTAHAEKNIPLLMKVIPFMPEKLLIPSIDALEKSIHKTKMRKAFRKYNKNITPRFYVFNELDKEKIDKIKKNFEFPVMVKPSGLHGSTLVQWVHSEQELEETLIRVFKNIQKIYTLKKGRGSPQVLVEEFIEGDIFSLDVHVDNAGSCYFNPLVKYKMAPQKGFDDFFVYDVSTPVKIKPEVLQKAHDIAQQGIEALGLRNSTAHVELIKDIDNEWKIIEIGPRVGGNRAIMYQQSYGIDIDLNDVYIHTNKKPLLPKKVKGFTSIMRFYPRDEGYIKKTSGINKVKKLDSFVSLDRRLKKGDRCLHSKNGGVFVFKINLFNVSKAQLTADKRVIEKMVHIETVKSLRKL